MTQADIMSAFQEKTVKRFISDHANKRTIPVDAILLESFADGGELFIDVPTFLTLFGALDLTHANLSTSKLAQTTTWGKYFDDWKAQGIIT